MNESKAEGPPKTKAEASTGQIPGHALGAERSELLVRMIMLGYLSAIGAFMAWTEETVRLMVESGFGPYDVIMIVLSFAVVGGLIVGYLWGVVGS